MKFSSDVKVLNSASKSNLFEKLEIDTTEIVEYARKEIKPELGNRYVANDEKIVHCATVEKIGHEVFAGTQIQSGWCFGGGKAMNGVEWHESAEVVVACTDTGLLLGDCNDIKNDVYESKKTVALSLKKGEAVKLMPRTLHLAPLAIDEYFVAAIILPKGTNLPLKGGIKGTHRAVNKWLLVHPENKKGIELGGKIGVEGDNIRLI